VFLLSCFAAMCVCISDSVHGFNECNNASVNGVYLWTAGRDLGSRQFYWASYSNSRQLTVIGIYEADYMWYSSDMRFTLWYPGQPDNSNGLEHCVNIWPMKYYKWNDEDCSHHYCFVCEDRTA